MRAPKVRVVESLGGLPMGIVTEYAPTDDPTPEAMKSALYAFNLRRWTDGEGLIDPLDFRDCREATCEEGIVFLMNPATGEVARHLGRSAILVEIKGEYVALTRERTRIGHVALDTFPEHTHAPP